MTPIEIGLTVAVVVLGIGLLGLTVLLYLVWRNGCLTHARLFDGDSAALRLIQKLNGTIDTILEGDAIVTEHLEAIGDEVLKEKAALTQFIKLANGSEQKRDARLSANEQLIVRVMEIDMPGMLQSITDLESRVDGIQVSREVLTEPEFVDRINRVPLTKVADLAYVTAAHASTDFDLTGLTTTTSRPSD